VAIDISIFAISCYFFALYHTNYKFYVKVVQEYSEIFGLYICCFLPELSLQLSNPQPQVTSSMGETFPNPRLISVNASILSGTFSVPLLLHLMLQLSVLPIELRVSRGQSLCFINLCQAINV
jgi:hypothetical protein